MAGHHVLMFGLHGIANRSLSSNFHFFSRFNRIFDMTCGLKSIDHLWTHNYGVVATTSHHQTSTVIDHHEPSSIVNHHWGPTSHVEPPSRSPSTLHKNCHDMFISWLVCSRPDGPVWFLAKVRVQLTPGFFVNFRGGHGNEHQRALLELAQV